MERWLSIGAVVVSLASAIMAGLALRKNIAYVNVEVEQANPITYRKIILCKNGIDIVTYSSSFNCNICNPSNQHCTVILYLIVKHQNEKSYSKKLFIEMSPNKTIIRYVTFEGFVIKTKDASACLNYKVNNKTRKTNKFTITNKYTVSFCSCYPSHA